MRMRTGSFLSLASGYVPVTRTVSRPWTHTVTVTGSVAAC
jgi:hypothetical protein